MLKLTVHDTDFSHLSAVNHLGLFPVEDTISYLVPEVW